MVNEFHCCCVVLRYPGSEKREQVEMADTVRVERSSEQSEQSRAEHESRSGGNMDALSFVV